MKRIPPWIIILIGAVLLTGGGYVYSKIRGIRNNNPGNIRHTKDVWKGERPKPQQTDLEFVQFEKPEWGIRAMARILMNDYRKGKNTVKALINEWAPPVENDTGAYEQSVAKDLGIGTSQPFNVESRLPDLISAIIKHENGIQPYGKEVITEGIRLERYA